MCIRDRPDTGYVVDAAGFSASSPLPTGIESVTFTNSTTAFAIGNVVNVTANFDDGSPNSNFVMPSANVSLNIGICESNGVIAVIPFVSVPVSFTWGLVRNNRDNLGGTSTVVLNNDSLVTNVDISGSPNVMTVNGVSPFQSSITGTYPQTTSLHYNTISTTYDPSVPGTKLLASGTYTACHASENPTICITNITTTPPFVACVNGIDPTGYVCNLDPQDFANTSFMQNLPSIMNGYIETLYYNSLGFVNAFDWKVEMNGGFTQAELDALSYTPATSHSNNWASVAGILGFTLVQPDLNDNGIISSSFTIHKFEDSSTSGITPGWDIPVSDLGESRDLLITGTPGATFSATFVNASGTTILASPITNVVLPSNGKYAWTQVFPPLGSGTTTYTLVFSAGANTALSTLFTSRSPSSTFVYNQISTIPNISLNGSSSSNFATSTTQSVSSTFPVNYRFGSTNNTYPVSMSITKVGGGNLSITRQPIWPDDWSNSDPATNGGTIINLSGLTIAGSGTSTLTLSGTGSRSLIGASTQVMSLALDNFIDNSGGANVDVTNISLNTSPVASQSFNIGDDIDVKAVLTPSNPTTPTLAWTVSGSGFTLTPAADTQSCLVKSESTVGTRVVTATATDGSGITGTINITATQQVIETVNDTISVYSGRSTVIDITANDTTLGGGCTVVIESDPEVGSLAVSGQTVTYTALDFAAQDTFTYKLTKTGLAASNISTVTVLVGIN